MQFLIILALVSSLQHESCRATVIKSVIGISIQEDMVSRFDIESEDAPENDVFYFSDIIQLDSRLHKDLRPLDNSQSVFEDNYFFNVNDRLSSGYVGFASNISRDTVMVNVLLNRGEHLNTYQSERYLQWRMMNIGMSYLFIFSDDGTLEKLSKRPLN